METFAEFIVLPIFFVGFIAPVFLIGRWILGPIDRAARARNAPVQFSIADFLCLFVVIQIPLAFAHQFSGDETGNGFFLFLTVVTWIVAPVIWIATTRALSKAGVGTGKHRLIFMGLIVPLAYYGLIPFVAMALAGPMLILTGESPRIAGFGWYVLLWLVLGVLLYLGGRYTQWMVWQADLATDGDPPLEGSRGRMSPASPLEDEASHE